MNSNKKIIIKKSKKRTNKKINFSKNKNNELLSLTFLKFKLLC